MANETTVYESTGTIKRGQHAQNERVDNRRHVQPVNKEPEKGHSPLFRRWDVQYDYNLGVKKIVQECFFSYYGTVHTVLLYYSTSRPVKLNEMYIYIYE
jgi:hypothetical protein